ncbi:hypothetical protein LEN26_006878 [Aphanomyces euteiches]|nr:hypothetical protein AeMF1_003216 [Aphanomyces euteiches]KAH9134072.1 hypothetical protein LEN26_006878 [Aphanomyces euteiches]
MRWSSQCSVLPAAVIIALVLVWSLWPPPRVLPPLELPHDRVPGVWTDETFECVGWQAVQGCDGSASAPRDPQKDQACDFPIKAGMAGYCLVRNRTSGQTFRVMRSGCKSVRPIAEYTCNQARQFTDFAHKAATYEPSEQLQLKQDGSRGIVLSVYEPAIPGVYAIIKLLRQQGCVLPIELFYMKHEMNLDNPVLKHLLATDTSITLREIPLWLDKFATKPYAIFHSAFDQLLFLDCDNFPTRDPTYLFDHPAFVSTGAIFWPDYWTPANSMFGMNHQSLLWELFDMPPFGFFEQESGQLLIDRTKSIDALTKLAYYNDRIDVWGPLRVLHGDKDLWRLAWHNTSTPYHFVERPPAIGGMYDFGVFCGVAMLQHTPLNASDVAFVHANTMKIHGDPAQVPVWTHVQSFAADDPRWYVVSNEGEWFFGTPSCWGLNFLAKSTVKSIAKTNIGGSLELDVLKLAREAGRMMNRPPNPSRVPSMREFLDKWFSLVALVAAIFIVVAVATVLQQRVLTDGASSIFKQV